jgi:large repetitive protein
LAGVPLDETVSCSALLNVPTVTASDVCSGTLTPTLVSISTQTNNGSCTDNSYTITNTWTATDACGNTASAVQVMTVTDTELPVWTTVIGALNVLLACDDAAGLALAQTSEPVATDCDNSLTLVKNSGQFVPNQTCPQGGTYINTWTVTDNCGNESLVYTQVISVEDTQSPTWITSAGALNVSLDCADALGLTSAQALFPTATDLCDVDVSNIVKTAGTLVSGFCPQSGTITNTWTVTDDCGNTSVAYTQVITITDLNAPVWSTVSGALDRTLQCNDLVGFNNANCLLL